MQSKFIDILYAQIARTFWSMAEYAVSAWLCRNCYNPFIPVTLEQSAELERLLRIAKMWEQAEEVNEYYR